MTRLTVLALAAALLTGCTAAPSASTPVRSEPAPVPPATPVPASPSGFSDYIPYTDLLVGTVIRGGDGPCYGVRTDDGTEYLLHSTEGFVLPYGKRVKLRTDMLHARLDCGTGTPQRLVAVVSIN